MAKRSVRRAMVVIALASPLACGTDDAGRRSSPEPARSGDAADATLVFLEIEGGLAELAALRTIDGLELERGARRVAGDRHAVGAFARRRSALTELGRRGLVVRVVMDEAEARRRIEAERDEIRRSSADAGAGPPIPP